jgi:hypothetical protein
MRFYVSHLHTSCAIKQFGMRDFSYKEFEAKKKVFVCCARVEYGIQLLLFAW